MVDIPDLFTISILDNYYWMATGHGDIIAG